MRKRTAQLYGNGAGLNLVISQSICSLLYIPMTSYDYKSMFISIEL